MQTLSCLRKAIRAFDAEREVLSFSDLLGLTTGFELFQKDSLPQGHLLFSHDHGEPVLWIVFIDTFRLLGLSRDVLEQAVSDILCFSNINTDPVIEYSIDTCLPGFHLRNRRNREVVFLLFRK